MKNEKNKLFFFKYNFLSQFKKIREGFDKILTFLIEHLKANKGELRLISRVFQF